MLWFVLGGLEHPRRDGSGRTRARGGRAHARDGAGRTGTRTNNTQWDIILYSLVIIAQGNRKRKIVLHNNVLMLIYFFVYLSIEICSIELYYYLK